MLVGNFTGDRFGDRLGLRKVLLVSSTFVGRGTLAIPWLPTAVLAVGMPLLGYAGTTAEVSQGALVALAVPAGDRRRSVAVTRAAPPHLVGQYQGLYTGAATSGSMLAPPVGAFVYGPRTALAAVQGRGHWGGPARLALRRSPRRSASAR